MYGLPEKLRSGGAHALGTPCVSTQLSDLCLTLPPTAPAAFGPDRAGCLWLSFLCALGAAGEGPALPYFGTDSLRNTPLHRGGQGWGGGRRGAEMEYVLQTAV